MPGPRKPAQAALQSVKSAGGRPNSIGLGQRELGELLDRIEHPESRSEAPKRDFVRWPFRQTSVRVQFMHPGGVPACVTVACRNISRAGMAILHSAYSHTGTKCRVFLPHPTKGEVAMDGWVTRCSHRSGVIHEIGIRFEKHVDVQDILRPNPCTDWFSLERVNPEDLMGTVVHVDSSEIDRRILKHFLRESKLNVVTANSGAEALACIDETIDLVVSDYHLGDMTGIDLVRKVREHGLELPMMLTTCDVQVATAETLGSVRAGALLAKPFSQDLLLRAIGEFLIVQRSPAVGRPCPTVSNVNPALTKGLLSALGQLAIKLEDCVVRSDAAMARTHCLQIAGTAGTVGSKDVVHLANKAAESLSRSMSVTESISAVRTLVAACKRAAERASVEDEKKSAA